MNTFTCQNPKCSTIIGRVEKVESMSIGTKVNETYNENFGDEIMAYDFEDATGIKNDLPMTVKLCTDCLELVK